MRVQNLTDPRIEFVFGEVNNQLKRELRAFWSQHGNAYQEELKSFRATLSNNQKRMGLLKKPISRQPAAISRDQSGEINGIVFVVLRELEASLGLGSHAYFQRMYITPTARHLTINLSYQRLANQLFRAFLEGFDREVEKRDHRAKVLLAENINPGLQKASMRRYFARLGFQMLGGNQLGGEIWARKLKTHFSF
ncbi:acyl-CoA N-acyltransferase [Synechococcus sp. ROS8604]|nr:acyl-CoA N-acyltransferase [Synechococcus sp. ROS8604]QNI89872.1 acyl-CoA N-acyltransferase [Synechococcus sp. ROS8604]